MERACDHTASHDLINDQPWHGWSRVAQRVRLLFKQTHETRVSSARLEIWRATLGKAFTYPLISCAQLAEKRVPGNMITANE